MMMRRWQGDAISLRGKIFWRFAEVGERKNRRSASIYEKDKDRSYFTFHDKNEIEENLINDLSQPFSNLFNAYSKAYNKKYDRIGSLFQKPFRRKLIDSNHYLLDCIAYVNTNAQHHNLCESDGEYEYSSYQSTIEGNDVLVDAEKCIELFDGRENFINIHDEKKLILNEEFEN